MRTLGHRIKGWWDIWVFVLGFPLGLVFLFFFWWYLLKLSSNPLWIIIVSIVFLYAAMILIVATVIAVSENNFFVSSFILLFIGVTIGVLGYFYTQRSFQLNTDQLVTDFYSNVSTELISIVITVLAIETLRNRIHWRNYQREKQRQETTAPPVPQETIEETKTASPPQSGTTNKSYYNRGELVWGVLIGIGIGLLLRQNGTSRDSNK